MEERQARIARDAHGERTRFEDIEVGADLGRLSWEVTPADAEKQCLIDDDYDAAYVHDAPLGARIAPPQIQYRPPRWLLSRTYNIRGVFYGWSFENVRPIRVGETLEVSGTVADKWIKRDREYVAFEFRGHDAAGDLVFRTRRVHVLDVLSRAAPREGEGVDSGHKPERI